MIFIKEKAVYFICLLTVILFPIILGGRTIDVGMQATVTEPNSYAISGLDMILMDDYDQGSKYESFLIHRQGMKCLEVVYANVETLDYINIMSQAINDTNCEVMQFGNEVDLSSGINGYFGGWGIDHVKEYVQRISEIKKIIGPRKLIIGLSTITGWKEWLQAFAEANGMEYIDAIGLHIYYRYPENPYNKGDMLTTYTDQVKIYPKPFWITEIGLRGNPLDKGLAPAQAQFIKDTFHDLINSGANVVLYYGYNPAWEGVDIKNNPEALKALRDIVEEYK